MELTEEDLEQMAKEAAFVEKATKEHGNEYWPLTVEYVREVDDQVDGFTKWLYDHGYKKQFVKA